MDKELKDIGKAAREENTSIDKGGARYYFFKPNPGLEIIITEWKNSLEGVQHQTQTSRRKISKLKEKSFEMIKFEELKEERMKKSG